MTFLEPVSRLGGIGLGGGEPSGYRCLRDVGLLHWEDKDLTGEQRVSFAFSSDQMGGFTSPLSVGATNGGRRSGHGWQLPARRSGSDGGRTTQPGVYGRIRYRARYATGPFRRARRAPACDLSCRRWANAGGGVGRIALLRVCRRTFGGWLTDRARRHARDLALAPANLSATPGLFSARRRPGGWGPTLRGVERGGGVRTKFEVKLRASLTVRRTSP